MKCRELGNQGNESNGNWEAKKQEMGVLNLLRLVSKGSEASQDTGRRDVGVGTWAPEDVIISSQLRKCTWGKEN